jgi:hypothetical protein
MASFTVRLRSAVEYLLISQWGAYARVFMLYWSTGVGLHRRRRGALSLVEIMVLPAPAVMIATIVMTGLEARAAPISQIPAFRRWLRVLGLYILFIGNNGR